MDKLTNLSILETIQDMFWNGMFYVILYALCMLSLIVFWKTMERGRRFFFLFSVICLVLFIYNPIFVNLCEKYLLRGDQVIVRLFLLLPVFFVESYVFTKIVMVISKRSVILSVVVMIPIVLLLFFLGITPWTREEKGWTSDMYLMAENPYKIPQEHIDITEAILNDMDGDRATLSLYELHWINDIGGTLNFSIRMCTSRIQLSEVMSLDSYKNMSDEDRVEYWDEYMTEIQSNDTDSSSYYFIFPLEDERASDLISYGCEELPIGSSTYQLLVYTP